MNNTVNRNYGIDLLRIISNSFVVLIHCLRQGGVLNNLNEGSRTALIAWFLFACGSCAVDIFGLISGYVSYDLEIDTRWISRWLRLWMEVIWYGVLVRIVKMVFFSAALSFHDMICAFFPVYFNEYWYFSSYSGLMLVAPLLNKGIKSLSDIAAKKLFWTLIVVFSIYASFFPNNAFSLDGGQSVIWLVVLYCLGCIIKKCELGKDVNAFILVSGIVLFAITTMAFRNANSVMIECDISPTLLGQAILYLFLFKNLKVKDKLARIIEFAAAGSFAIYLLDRHIPKDFIFVAKSHAYTLATVVLSFTLVVVIASLLVDRIRIIVFRLLHVRQFTDWIGKKVGSIRERN